MMGRRELVEFLMVTGGLHFVWETLHLPLYTLWKEASLAEILWDITSCTTADIIIAAVSFSTALVVIAKSRDQPRQARRFSVWLLVTGLSITTILEILNVYIWENWAYSEHMPIVPLLDVGLSPMAQWLVIPLLGLWWLKKKRGSPVAHA